MPCPAAQPAVTAPTGGALNRNRYWLGVIVVTFVAATLLISKSLASKPWTGSEKSTVISVNDRIVAPGGGRIAPTVGGKFVGGGSRKIISSDASNPTSLLFRLLWNTCTAITFVPARKYDDGENNSYVTNDTGSAALFASVNMLTGAPSGSAMFTRCTSVPLIHATNPSSTIAPNCSEAISETLVMTKVFRRNREPYTFCIPLICVPPGRVSPYQKGAGAGANSASLKPTSRHAVTGVE